MKINKKSLFGKVRNAYKTINKKAAHVLRSKNDAKRVGNFEFFVRDEVEIFGTCDRLANLKIM